MTTGQDRVVALVDMDCFFVQVEQRQNPHLRNKPCAVVQYKSWKGGGIIAVSYEARAFGVTRNMWADDAKKLCPDLLLAQVRESRGKANLTKYREASVEVMEVMSRFAVIERASIDEAYVDLTSAVQEKLQKLQGHPISADLLPTTYIEGLPQDLTTTKETVQKGTSIASLLLLLPAFGTCFEIKYILNELQGLVWKDIQILLSFQVYAC
uniref:UmuC domain-containing protein n=1 Tax=Spermophilus dauricus TaxID=99837 RepID=A0A8C9URN2_SPEDA